MKKINCVCAGIRKTTKTRSPDEYKVFSEDVAAKEGAKNEHVAARARIDFAVLGVTVATVATRPRPVPQMQWI